MVPYKMYLILYLYEIDSLQIQNQLFCTTLIYFLCLTMQNKSKSRFCRPS